MVVIRSDTFTIMTSRILGGIGRFFITTGVVILLFVAYQLWGTGLQEASAQNNLGSDFDELLESVPDTLPTTTAAAPSTTALESGPTTTTTSTTLPAAGGTIPVFDTELAENLFREGGEAIARINIPKINATKVVVQGVKVEDLRNGPGHYRATPFPGQAGNSGIAGHRTTYGAPFNRIDELVPGDEIRVTTVQGAHVYRVLPAGEAYGPEAVGSLSDFQVPADGENLGHIIVPPQATWVLGDFGDNRITLTACHPKYSARERIIVAAELVSGAVDTPEAPENYSVEDKIELPTEDLAAEAAGQDAADSQIVASAGNDVPDDSDNSAEIAAGQSPGGEVSLDEGLNGDKTALRPALLWGILAIAAYLFFKELAKRWMFWPSLALGIAPVVILMGLSFEKIDRYLPAG